MASRIPRRPRAWQRMLSGRRLDLLDPSPLDIEIADIALGLSRVARWNGQTLGDWGFSVAQHSLLVESLVAEMMPGIARRWRLAALLHDAAEYVVGDLITPFKAAVGEDFHEIEDRLNRAVRLRFALPAALPGAIARAIKRADKAAAFFEATQLAGFGRSEAERLIGRARGLSPPTLAPWPPREAERRFLERFHALGGS